MQPADSSKAEGFYVDLLDKNNRDADPIASFIAGGVLERHPTLRVAHLEAGSGWLVPWLYPLQVANQGGRGDERG